MLHPLVFCVADGKRERGRGGRRLRLQNKETVHGKNVNMYVQQASFVFLISQKMEHRCCCVERVIPE